MHAHLRLVAFLTAAVLLPLVLVPLAIANASPYEPPPSIGVPDANAADAFGPAQRYVAQGERIPEAGQAPAWASGSYNIESANSVDDALSRLGPELAAKALSGGDELVLIEMMTRDEPGIDALVESWRATTVRIAGMRTVAALVRADRLTKLALHSDVVMILPAGEPLAPVAPSEPPSTDGATGGDATIDLWYARQLFGADRAMANGFDGTGVIVGIEDTGCDFGHPDLRNTFARADLPGEWYNGYPLVYDNDSAARYLTQDGSPSGTYWADSTDMFTATVPYGAEGTAEVVIPASRLRHVDDENVTDQVTVTRTITYVNRSRSGHIHYGIHPDRYLRRTEYEVLPEERITYTVDAVFLVMDDAEPETYDSVFVDLGQQGERALHATYAFTNVVAAQLGPDKDPTVDKDLTGDGLADLSGGLIYFIADGEHHVPILDWLWDAHGEEDEDNFVEPPAPGAMVAFYGDFSGSSHGTGVATQIAGQGRINAAAGVGITTPPGTHVVEYDRVGGGVSRGMAPGSKLFATRRLGLPNQWLATSYGYDGNPGTGDEAQVVNNSWGSTDLPSSLQNAYDALSTALNTTDVASRTLFVVSAGNGGQGAGTISSPSSGSTVFAVGAGNQFGTNDQIGIISDTVQISSRDMASFSSRGPDLMGRSGIAALAVGAGSSGGRPLNSAGRSRGRNYDGNHAWVLFGGTSQAGPQASGVAALAFEAYKDQHGEFPTYDVARSLLQFGADDTGQDPAVQGAGHVNADQTTASAAGLFGATISDSEWQVGDYRGKHYLDFPNVASPGESYQRSFTLTNSSEVPLSLDISSSHLQLLTRRRIVIETDATFEDAYQYKRPDYLVKLNIPPGTETVQVRLAQPFEGFCNEDPASEHTGCGVRGSSAFYLRAYAWHDWNGNGFVWDDTNGNGVVNEGELDLPMTPTGRDEPDPRTSLELSAVSESNLSANSQDLRIHDPQDRGGEAMYLGLIHRVRSEDVPTETIRLDVSYYRHRPWPALSLDKRHIDLAPGTSGVVEATVSLPNNAPYGYHQGAIRVDSRPGTGDQSDLAGLRILHALPGLGAFDVYIDNQLVAERLMASSVTSMPYIDVTPGQRRVRITPSGLPPTILTLIDGMIEIRSGTEYTLALVSVGNAPFRLIPDGNLQPPAGTSRVRFGHMSTDQNPVDVYLDGQLLFEGVAWWQMTPPIDIPDGTHTLTVTRPGDSDPLLRVGPAELTRANLTLYAVGSERTGSLEGVSVTAPRRTHYPRHMSSVPVVVNVGAQADLWQPITLGGTPAADTPYDVGRVFGLYDWRGNGTARQGDWRNFFVDVPATDTIGVNSQFLMRTRWPRVPTDIDLLAWTPEDRPIESIDGETTEVVHIGGKSLPVDPKVSGPHNLVLSARTQDTSHASNGSSGTAYSFHTVTGTSEEWLAGPLASGLNLFSHHNVLLDGADARGSAYSSTLGAAEVVPSRVQQLTEYYTGTFTVSLRTAMELPGIEVEAYGLQAIDAVTGVVQTGSLHGVDSTQYYTVTAENSGMLHAVLEPAGSWPNYDLDMFLEMEDDEGEFQRVAGSTGPDAHEEISQLKPEDGTYRFVVHGFEVPPGAYYRIRTFNAQGDDMQVSGVPDGPLPAGETATFRVDYVLQFEEGARDGVVFVGPTGAPLVFRVPVRIGRSTSTIHLPLVVKGY